MAGSNRPTTTDTTRARQADGRKLNYRVLITSLLIAIAVAAILYTGWYLIAAPVVAPV
jgi:hypothetical protein